MVKLTIKIIFLLSVGLSCAPGNSASEMTNSDTTENILLQMINDLRKQLDEKTLALENKINHIEQGTLVNLKKEFNKELGQQKANLTYLEQNTLVEMKKDFDGKLDKQKVELFQFENSTMLSLKTELNKELDQQKGRIKNIETNVLTSLKSEFNKELEQERARIAHLEQNPVPIGFIYAQVLGQKDPKSLWPNTEWQNISPMFPGLFFRVEGGQAAPFGQVQEQQTQSIEAITNDCGRTGIKGQARVIGNDVNYLLWTGGTEGDAIGIGFKHNQEEIRPKNSAIKLWQRVK